MRTRQFITSFAYLAAILAGANFGAPAWAQQTGQPQKQDLSAPPPKVGAAESGAGQRGHYLSPSTEPGSPPKVTTQESGEGPRGTKVAPSTDQGQVKK
ncbi:MAG: hypothetical protein JOY71_26175 [Acetobacteraceae bacterium]|nr:hypothetical protein [Acetobacteraceae bacterium]MBV8525568.1 hypothetical protein [Acetobacteraceae bacterium]